MKDHPLIKDKLITFKVRPWMMGSLAGAATSYKITEVYKGELIYNFFVLKFNSINLLNC